MGESDQPPSTEWDMSTRHDGAPPALRIVALLGSRGDAGVQAAIRVLAQAGFTVEVVVGDRPSSTRSAPDLIIHAAGHRGDGFGGDGQGSDGDESGLAAGSGHVPEHDVESGRLRIDVSRKRILVDGLPLRASAREYTLLHYLASHPDVVFSREQLLHAVWGSNWRTEGSVTEYVRRLRILLEPTGIGECIVTRKGFGYCFDPSATQFSVAG